MFPGDSDPNFEGTGGVFVEPWSETSASNPPADRRFVMSMGPVTLEAGGKNDFTMAVLWARAEEGGPEASVEVLRAACDEVQSLFDSCFEQVGCMDETALNFDADATVSLPGDCLAYEVGCGTEEAANWPSFDWTIQWMDDSWSGAFGMAADAPMLVIPGATFIEGIGDVTVASAVLVQVQALPVGLSADLPLALTPGQMSCIELSGNPEQVGTWPSVWELLVTTDTGQEHLLELPLSMVVAAAQGGGTLPGMTSQKVTKWEGAVTGYRKLRLTEVSEAELILSPSGKANEVTYEAGQGPIDVYVLEGTDELAEFSLGFDDIDHPEEIPFTLVNHTAADTRSGFSRNQTTLMSIQSGASPWPMTFWPTPMAQRGIARQRSHPPSLQPWLSGHEDEDGYSERNWIRSGRLEYQDAEVANEFLSPSATCMTKKRCMNPCWRARGRPIRLWRRPGLTSSIRRMTAFTRSFRGLHLPALDSPGCRSGTSQRPRRAFILC